MLYDLSFKVGQVCLHRWENHRKHTYPVIAREHADRLMFYEIFLLKYTFTFEFAHSNDSYALHLLEYLLSSKSTSSLLLFWNYKVTHGPVY